ncbi:MAG TPA: tRNA pseudouridine(13) synthase TruD [Phycisphaerales bacterium]|nr:tRNA pseudouridine(13) synthase TruD [Phycisphaerales bacterium]
MTRSDPGAPDTQEPSRSDGVPKDTSTHVIPRQYITADIPGIGGQIKQRPEDFLVDEIPQYTPSGEGEHIYLTVTKRGLSTMEMVEVLARHFGVHRRAIGYAGLKDKHAITRQMVSVHVPGKKIEHFPELRNERLAIVGADYHANKLRPGHLKGNRFSVRIRNVKPTDVLAADRVLRRLAKVGVPNRVGEQRFGMLENNHLVGRHLITGDFDAAVRELLGANAAHPELNAEARRLFAEGRYQEAGDLYPRSARTEQRVLYRLSKGASPPEAMLALDEPILRYYFSAFQSAVFNAVLDGRVSTGTLATLAPGDLAVKHENLAVFAVDDAVAADPETAARLARFEISPSGPMWGGSMVRAGGETGVREQAVLESFGVTPAQLETFDSKSPFKLEGKRRPLRVPVIDPEVEGGVDEHGPYVRCAFELPKGSFATVVLREVMKPAVVKSGEWEEVG